MVKIGKNRIISLLVILFGLFIIFESTKIKAIFAIDSADVGPKMFPQMAAGGMILCAIGKFITAKETDKYVPYFSKEGWKRVIIAFAMFVTYIFAMEYLGFLISTPIMLFALANHIAGDKKLNKVVTLIFSIAVAGIIYFVFHNLMFVMLPAGKIFG